MFDRYFVSVYIKTDKSSYSVCDTYFKTIDQVVKFIDRFNDQCFFTIHDELFEEKFIDAQEILQIWRSR